MDHPKSPSNKNNSFLKKLTYATQGLVSIWRKELSFRIQVGCAIALFCFCLFVRPPGIWCAVFTLAATFVLALEVLNTAMEALLDKLHPGRDPDIGFMKDCLAGAVLISSIGSVVIFLIYLIDHVSQRP